MIDAIISLLAATIRLSTPIMLAALGEIFAERSGVLNLGIEGIMLMGALFGVMGPALTGSYVVGILLAVFIGALMGLLMAFMSVSLRLNQVLAGLAVMFLGMGLSTLISRSVATMRVETLSRVSIPLLSQIPVIGEILFQNDILVYLTLILVVISAIVLFRTTIGLKIRAVGENPKAADTLGVSVFRYRYICVVIGGMLAAIGGSYLTMGEIGTFREAMVAGRGWIALAIVNFGRWSPYRSLLGSLVFGGVFALQLRLQVQGVAIPYEILLMLPYILTIAIMMLTSRKAVGPAALTVPYVRN